MKLLTIFFISIFISVLSFSQVNSTDTLEGQYGEIGIKAEKRYVITRFDGKEYIGEILKDDGYELLIKTKVLGLVYIPKYEVENIIEISDNKIIKYGNYQPEGPFTTRYSFTTNSYSIIKGENYGMLNIYGPEVHIAVSNKLNIGIMTSWIASPLVVVMKYSFEEKIKKVNFSFGTMMGTSGYLNAFKGYGGLHWLSMTLGDRKNNFNFSAGYAYIQPGIVVDEPASGIYTEQEYAIARENLSEYNKIIQGPIISFASLFKIGGRASFIFDSMIGYFNHEIVNSEYNYNELNDTYSIIITRNINAFSTALFIMPGVRFQNNDNRAFQICVAGVSTFGDFDFSTPLPMISWFYKF